MSYFRFFPSVNYRFGNELSYNLFPQLNAYVDLIDQVKDANSFYLYVDVKDGDRPDHVSYGLYETTQHYWTFYLLNDHIRRQGWPISDNEVIDFAKKNFPNRTLTFREHLYDKFQIGEVLTGTQSAATGTVVSRNLNLGQIVVKPTNSYTFSANESVYSLINGVTTSATTVASTLEYLSVHHYEDGNQEIADFNPALGPGSELSAKTWFDICMEENQKLKKIKAFRPDVIDDIVDKFRTELRTSL